MVTTRKFFVFYAVFYFFISYELASQPIFSGLAEGSASIHCDANKKWNYTFEKFANLRFSVRNGEFTRVNGSANTSAVSGLYTPLSVNTELERLYVSLRSTTSDIDFGLLRLPFGFGMGFRPSDIFAVQAPLFPEARMKGVLGAVVSVYPGIENKIQFFVVDTFKMFAQEEKKSDYKNVPSTGIAFDHHGEAGSFQSLYVVTSASKNNGKIQHIFAGSLKIDLVVGFVIDAVYLENKNIFKVASGIDYSVFNGKIFFLVQHYWDGLAHEHAIFGMISYQYSDFSQFTLSATSVPHTSFVHPIFSISHEVFQGVTITSKTHIIYKKTYQGVGSSVGVTVRF